MAICASSFLLSFCKRYLILDTRLRIALALLLLKILHRFFRFPFLWSNLSVYFLSRGDNGQSRRDTWDDSSSRRQQGSGGGGRRRDEPRRNFAPPPPPVWQDGSSSRRSHELDSQGVAFVGGGGTKRQMNSQGGNRGKKNRGGWNR